MNAALPPQFFGYGSLVNLATHSYENPRTASLTGWRRVWRHALARPVAFLSVEVAPGSELLGITAEVPRGDWAALDAREHAYLRRDVSPQFNRPTALYEANPAHTTAPSAQHPILLSYLDVVISGYLERFGDEGAAHFFATTTGWGPVLDDRTAPIYPRALPVSAAIQARVDDALVALAVPVQPA